MTTKTVPLCQSRHSDGYEAVLYCILPRHHSGDHWAAAVNDKGLVRARAWQDDGCPLPTEPGFYVGDYPESPSGKILVELLNSPAGQWVDNTDSRYLNDTWVAALGNLTRLVPERERVGTDG